MLTARLSNENEVDLPPVETMALQDIIDECQFIVDATPGGFFTCPMWALDRLLQLMAELMERRLPH